MKIAIIGYGRMGREIENTALSRGHNISAIIDKNNADNIADLVIDSDVAIDFTIPEKAFELCLASVRAGIPVVSGTTGWNDQLPSLYHEVKKEGGAFLHASNFSLGVNILFHINKKLAEVMNRQPVYDVSIKEIHHIHKVDAPSGTAITLAEDIISSNNKYHGWELSESATHGQLPIQAKRENEIPGIHQVDYESEIDQIQIRHEAFSRKGFALGAIVAAEFIVDRKGIFSMKDILGIT